MTAPFAAAATLPAAGFVLVSATAFDEFGNRSSTVTERVDITANAAPTIVLRAVDPVPGIVQGRTIEFDAIAEDDDRVQRLLLSAVGAAAFSESRTAPAAATTFSTRFAITVPADAPSGGLITVQAAAIDGAGGQSDTARITLTVIDGLRPSLTVVSPVNNAVILPGTPVTVTVDASDDTGVATVTVLCTPTLTGCSARAIEPAAAGTRQSFIIDIPAGFDGPSVGLLIRAADVAGNLVETSRTLIIPDQIAPSVVTLESASGSTRVVPGTPALLRATVSDATGVTSLEYETTGGFTTSGTAAVNPALKSGSTTFTLPIPVSVANGAVINVTVRARDAAGNTSAPAALTLTVGDAAAPSIDVLSPAAGMQVNPGQSITFNVRATDDTGVIRIAFAASGAVTAAESRTVAAAASVDAQFVVAVPAGSTAGPITLSAQAFDAAGNPSAAATRIVDVRDTAAPSVSVTAPADGATIDPQVADCGHGDGGGQRRDRFR